MSDTVTSELGPFAMLPEWLLFSGVSGNAVKLFGILHRHAGCADITPSRKRLADLMHCSVDTIDRTTKELERVGALSVERRKTGDGDYTSNAYYLHFSAPGAATAKPARRSSKNAETGRRTDAAQTKDYSNETLTPSVSSQQALELEAQVVAEDRVVGPKPLTKITEAWLDEQRKAFAERIPSARLNDTIEYWLGHMGLQVQRDKRAFLLKKLEEQANRVAQNLRPGEAPKATFSMRDADFVANRFAHVSRAK